MEFPDIPTGRSPRRELQGPRPTPLRIHKDSHKIKKPPLAPSQQQPQPPPRQPIIIYTVSPKVIHTTPSDFMNLVQSLTGSSSTNSSSSTSTTFPSSSISNDPFNGGDGMISPAARYATVEKAMSPLGKKQQQVSVPLATSGGDFNIRDVEGIAIDQLMNNIHGVERGNHMFQVQGILSPGPASLSPIPSNFFSPPSSSDPNMVNSFLHDFSPVLHSSRNFMEGGAFFLPTPSSNNFFSPHTPTVDLFNYFLD